MDDVDRKHAETRLPHRWRAVQATTYYQTYPRAQETDLHPKKVCNLDPMGPVRQRQSPEGPKVVMAVSSGPHTTHR